MGEDRFCSIPWMGIFHPINRDLLSQRRGSIPLYGIGTPSSDEIARERHIKRFEDAIYLDSFHLGGTLRLKWKARKPVPGPNPKERT